MYQPHRIRRLFGTFLAPPSLCAFAWADPIIRYTLPSRWGWEPHLLPLPPEASFIRSRVHSRARSGATAPSPRLQHKRRTLPGISQHPWASKAHPGILKPCQVLKGPCKHDLNAATRVRHPVTHCVVAIKPSGLTMSICTQGLPVPMPQSTGRETEPPRAGRGLQRRRHMAAGAKLACGPAGHTLFPGPARLASRGPGDWLLPPPDRRSCWAGEGRAQWDPFSPR